jgi:membrane-bound lytic murein transglycosylase D
MNKYLIGFSSAIALILIAALSYNIIPIIHAEEKKDVTIVEPLNKTYCVSLPSNINFCGEEVPISVQDVRERLDRELLVNTYWQSSTLLLLKEYNKMKALLEPTLKKYDVPDDFIFLAAAESGFKNVVSSSNAVGVWQMLKETATIYGLEINSEVDERYHFEKSTEAACLYLKSAHDKFGSWTMAACSYNMGMSGTQTAIDKQQAKSYYDLSLTQEPSRYVFRILALKEIISNPSKYGFIISENDLYKPYNSKTITVNEPITNLAEFALSNNMNYKQLKILNPWLRSSVLTNKYKKTYEIKLFQ